MQAAPSNPPMTLSFSSTGSLPYFAPSFSFSGPFLNLFRVSPVFKVQPNRMMRAAQLCTYSTAQHPVPRRDFPLCCRFRRPYRSHLAPVTFHLFHGVLYPPYAPPLSFLWPLLSNYTVYSAFCGHPPASRHAPNKLKEHTTGSVLVSGHVTPTRSRNSS